jgi:hypothetical protein
VSSLLGGVTVWATAVAGTGMTKHCAEVHGGLVSIRKERKELNDNDQSC